MRVPPYYNRVGPGLYDNIDVEKISCKITTPGFKMGPEPQKPYEVLINCSSDLLNGRLQTNKFTHHKLTASETLSIARTANNSGRKKP